MRIELELRPDYLHAIVGGRFDPAKMADRLKDIFTAGATHRVRKILIDVRTLQGNISAVARFDAGEIAAKLRGGVVRLAIVGSEAQIWPDRFMENVANNRGLFTKVTTDMAEALEWLADKKSAANDGK